MKRKRVLISFLFAILLLPTIIFSGTSNQYYEFFHCLKKSKNLSKANQYKKSTPIFNFYFKMLNQKEKKMKNIDDKDLSLKMLYSNYHLEYFQFDWHKEKLNHQESSFYYLHLAIRAFGLKDHDAATKLFFQSFLLFQYWKNRFPFLDKIVFINEWYFQFSRFLFSKKNLNKREANKYLSRLLLSSSHLISHAPEFIFFHPLLSSYFFSNYLKHSSDKLFTLERKHKISKDEKLFNSLMKLFLINAILLVEEKNLIKANIYITYLLGLFQKNPITEDLFFVYQETLKNKIFISMKFSQENNTSFFLKKYLEYSVSCDRLRENYQDLDQFLSKNKHLKNWQKKPFILKILKKFQIVAG